MEQVVTVDQEGHTIILLLPTCRRAVVNGRLSPQLGRLLLRRGIAEEAAPADLWPGQVLEQIGAAERRMDFDVEMEARSGVAVGWRLVQN
jgi:hypothetical protein